MRNFLLSKFVSLTTSLFFAVVLLGFVISIPPAFAERPPDDECGYYGALSTRLQCDHQNYLTTFGDHYCRYFLKHDENYSYSGLVALQSIRRCLIRSLHDRYASGLARQSPALTCENVRPFAISTHLACYLESGFCALGPLDKTRIAYGLRHTIFKDEFQPVVQALLNECSR